MTCKRTRSIEPIPLDPIAALEDAWRERGPQSLKVMRQYDPGAYVRLLADLVLEDD